MLIKSRSTSAWLHINCPAAETSLFGCMILPELGLSSSTLPRGALTTLVDRLVVSRSSMEESDSKLSGTKESDTKESVSKESDFKESVREESDSKA